jgi:glyceraldehyde-3-phosphate dehydrogenase/erythrose-4-phosphate dehydrogenase
MSRQEVIQVGINGFGRIGRAVFKQLLQREEFRVGGINDLNNIEDLAYLLKMIPCTAGIPARSLARNRPYR